MLPHVDSFRPIHNLASMADLCRALSGAEGSQTSMRVLPVKTDEKLPGSGGA
jgi:hypothetical protein